MQREDLYFRAAGVTPAVDVGAGVTYVGGRRCKQRLPVEMQLAASALARSPWC
jgi:hypothetical protein